MQFAALVVSILITILLEMNFSHSVRRLGRFFRYVSIMSHNPPKPHLVFVV